MFLASALGKADHDPLPPAPHNEAGSGEFTNLRHQAGLGEAGQTSTMPGTFPSEGGGQGDAPILPLHTNDQPAGHLDEQPGLILNEGATTGAGTAGAASGHPASSSVPLQGGGYRLGGSTPAGRVDDPGDRRAHLAAAAEGRQGQAATGNVRLGPDQYTSPLAGRTSAANRTPEGRATMAAAAAQAEHDGMIGEMRAAATSVKPGEAKYTSGFVTADKADFQRSLAKLEGMKPSDEGYAAQKADTTTKFEKLRNAHNAGTGEATGPWNNSGHTFGALSSATQLVNLLKNVGVIKP